MNSINDWHHLPIPFILWVAKFKTSRSLQSNKNKNLGRYHSSSVHCVCTMVMWDAFTNGFKSNQPNQNNIRKRRPQKTKQIVFAFKQTLL